MLHLDSSPNADICPFGSFSQMEQIMGLIDSLELPEVQKPQTEESEEKS